LRNARGLGRGFKIETAGFPRFSQTGGDGSETNGIFDLETILAGKFSQKRIDDFSEPAGYGTDHIVGEDLPCQVLGGL